MSPCTVSKGSPRNFLSSPRFASMSPHVDTHAVIGIPSFVFRIALARRLPDCLGVDFEFDLLTHRQSARFQHLVVIYSLVFAIHFHFAFHPNSKVPPAA